MGASAESNMWGPSCCKKLRIDSEAMSSNEDLETNGHLITHRKLVNQIIGREKIEFSEEGNEGLEKRGKGF